VSSETEMKQLIIEALNLEGMQPDEIGDDMPLFGEGLGLDSVDALELVVAMEKHYDMKIKSDEIQPEAFRDVRSLLAWVVQRRAAIDGTTV
jgi:acyl carrier protein